MNDGSIAGAIAAYMPEFLRTHAAAVLHAVVAMPLATLLGAVLAFRPRRRGTPPRSSPVIQTQIILALVGAVVMMIVGASLARAFGIVGAANLIRYRAKIEDPKDAVVMLATLSLGLACGVELYGLAVFATFFIMGVLWIVESLEPEARKTFDLRVITPDPTSRRPAIESILTGYKIDYELRSAGDKELVYEIQLPMNVHTGRVSNAILQRVPKDAEGETQVAWDEKKKK
jgi:uncharacterized membrane protein YhiD involved in acid resistance